ncbi:TPA: phage replisome organizer N-terminal domain-containing protein [Bacillus luti]
MADIKWIKLSTSMFEDEKIRLIESMPDADTLLIIWIKLLSQAGKINASGYIFLNENIPYTEDMLATIFNRPLNTVRMALDVFQKFGMIDIDEHHYINITNWGKHQSLDRLDQIREDTRKRVAAHRERKKQQSLPCNVTGNGDVTDIEEELELEEELDKEKDINKKNSPDENRQDIADENSIESSVSNPKEKDSKKADIPYKEIVDYLNEKAGTQYRATAKETQRLIKARYQDGFTLDDFKKVIDNKATQWLNNPEMSSYLRPMTLFGTKFEGYLNERPVPRKGTFKGGPSHGSSQQSDDEDFEYIGL